MNFFWGLVALCGSIKELAFIAKYLFDLAREQKEYSQRQAFLKEVKEAMKENVENLDNTRLTQVLDPNQSPFPRGNNGTGANGVSGGEKAP